MIQVDQQTKRKTMEKLKIYGVKDNSGDYNELTKKQELIATVFVDEDKKVVVETKDPKVKKDLLEAIYAEENVDKEGKPVFSIRGGAPTKKLKEIEEEERKKKIFKVWATYVRPGDPDFLAGLYDGIQRINPIENGWKKLGDYYVWSHDIIEE